MLLLNPGTYFFLGFNFLIYVMGRSKKENLEDKKVYKNLPTEDFSFIGMNATEYLAYLRHEKKGKKKEKREED